MSGATPARNCCCSAGVEKVGTVGVAAANWAAGADMAAAWGVRPRRKKAKTKISWGGAEDEERIDVASNKNAQLVDQGHDSEQRFFQTFIFIFEVAT